jgi:primosomal protein N' (replication factor Y)
MTYHESNKELRCHHCGHREQMSPVCSKCHGANLAYYGVGAEMLAKEFKKIFPEDKREIVQIEGSELSLKKIDPNKEQIIVGTQLAWPYLPWSKLSLAAFMDADTPLFIPEYLSTERVWQSIHDALFRLEKTTPLYIQTNKPEERIFTSFSEPSLFYKGELENRKIFAYPPYRFLLKLFVGSPTREEGTKETEKVYSSLAQLTNNSPDITINRPIELFPPFTKGNYWKAIILKLSYKNYKQLLRRILPHVPETWKVDPNPINLLNP